MNGWKFVCIVIESMIVCMQKILRKKEFLFPGENHVPPQITCIKIAYLNDMTANAKYFLVVNLGKILIMQKRQTIEN